MLCHQRQRPMGLLFYLLTLCFVSRQLAENQNVSWSEYWDFLHCFTNITSPKGLQQLEDHLKEQEALAQKQACWENNLNEVSEDLQQLRLDDSCTGDLSSNGEDLERTPNFVQYMASMGEGCVEPPVTKMRGTCTNSFDLRPVNLMQTTLLLNASDNPPSIDSADRTIYSSLENCDKGEAESTSSVRNNNNGSGDDNIMTDKILEQQMSGGSLDDSVTSFVTAADDLDLDYLDADTEVTGNSKPLPPIFLSGCVQRICLCPVL